MSTDFRALLEAVVAGNVPAVRRRLAAEPSLARARAAVGASRARAGGHFFNAIRHYAYAGDTALHIAAAAFQPAIARLLISCGADCRAANRLDAQPLHYACDTNRWNPRRQVAVIRCLLSAGADPNARDRFGVTPLHRAVRTRSAPAVAALLAGGADLSLRNKRGSTACDLANVTSGRSGSGSPLARRQQRRILAELRQSKARGS